MNINQFLCSATFASVASSLAAQAPAGPSSPQLAVFHTPGEIVVSVSGPTQPFFGAAIVSLSPDLAHYLVTLPPLLTNFAVLGAGFAESKLEIEIAQANVVPGIMFYVQGIVFEQPDAILSTNVGSFVLDASSPDGVLTDDVPLPVDDVDAVTPINRRMNGVRPVGDQAAAPMLDAETDGRSRRFGSIQPAPTQTAAPATSADVPLDVDAVTPVTNPDVYPLANRRISSIGPGN